MMSLENKTIGERIKKLRKASGMSQTELAKILGCDQASVSRLESGTQGTSALQLIQIANTFHVTPTAMASGRLNYWGVSWKFGKRPKLKKRYLSYNETNGREITPIISYLTKSMGEEKTQELLKEIQLEDLFSFPSDEKLSLRCYIDLIRAILEKGQESLGHIEHWIEEYRDHEIFGDLFGSFKAVETPLQINELIVKNQNVMDSIFTQKLEGLTEDTLIIRLKKRPYLQGVDLEKSKVAPILLQQKVLTHELLPQIFTGVRVNSSFEKEFKKNLTGEAILKISV